MADYAQLTMLPTLPAFDLGDDIVTNAVVGRDDPVAALVAPNCPYLVSGQFSPLPRGWAFDVAPGLPGNDYLNSRLSDTVLLGKCDLGQRAGANSKNVNFGKFRAALAFSYRRVASVPGNLVRHVYVMVTKHKMRGIAAWRVVACVQDEPAPIPIWVRQEIGDPVGLVFVPSIVSSAIAVITKSFPLPAIIGRTHLNLCPKGFWRVGSHDFEIA